MSFTQMIKIGKSGIEIENSCQLADYPLKVSGAKGIFLEQSNSNFVCGGNPLTNECYKFDSTSLSWKSMKPMNNSKCYHGMASTNDKVFVCGGLDRGSSTSCEKFENDSWNNIASLPTPLYRHCMVAINNETIVSIGGYDGSGVSNN